MDLGMYKDMFYIIYLFLFLKMLGKHAGKLRTAILNLGQIVIDIET